MIIIMVMMMMTIELVAHKRYKWGVTKMYAVIMSHCFTRIPKWCVSHFCDKIPKHTIVLFLIQQKFLVLTHGRRKW